MAKVSPKEKTTTTAEAAIRRKNHHHRSGKQQKKRFLNSTTCRSRKEYVRPGALRYSVSSNSSSRIAKSSSCTDLAKKRVLVLDSSSPTTTTTTTNKKNQEDTITPKPDSDCDSVISEAHSPLMLLSPQRTVPALFGGPLLFSSSKSGTPMTPRTPCLAADRGSDSDSRLESLPMDLLVKILCHLHHDQLRPTFHVSQKIRKAVIIARQFHFNYTTPDRSRQEMLRTMTPLPTEHWPFASKEEQKGFLFSSPHTPKAPKHGPRPPRFKGDAEIRQITTVLFQESVLTSKCIPPGLPKSVCKSFASNRALFCEDELCQAVAQNKLR
ncbi:hypothetical protein IFM89_001136 [Coptis chinensis]|uniref:F-box domain-containing protein n=1 Tax=Coptis chinensis TaxID=261450 RepID=A0A835M3M2_9MAGN|nr:hypothetical protein IFM89_001136 [Coptis chinensis]